MSIRIGGSLESGVWGVSRCGSSGGRGLGIGGV